MDIMVNDVELSSKLRVIMVTMFVPVELQQSRFIVRKHLQTTTGVSGWFTSDVSISFA